MIHRSEGERLLKLWRDSDYLGFPIALGTYEVHEAECKKFHDHMKGLGLLPSERVSRLPWVKYKDQ